MADKKKQHYVPQFYLRNFSPHDSTDKISFYRIPDDKLVERATIRDQAHENYFYGKREIEDSLADMEGVAAGIIGDAIEREKLPERLSAEHHALLVFTLMQAFRTRFAADEADELTETFLKRLAAEVPKLRDHLDDVSIRLTNAPVFSLGLAAECHPIAFDLRYKLLCNRTELPFITSDHPVVFYNQFLEPRKTFGSNTGLAAKGLQMFLPLSPGHTLLFFDADVYKVGGRKLNSRRVDVTDPADVDSLNLLQAANANITLYFNGQVGDAVICRLVRRAAKFREGGKTELHEYARQPGGNGGGSLPHLHRSDVRTGLSLRCVSVSPHAERYESGNRVVRVRDPMLCALHDEFLAAVQAKKYTVSQFGTFLKDKRLAVTAGG